MRRRELILGLGSIALVPLPARAQGKRPLVGILDPKATNPPLLEHVRKGLAETGYREGQNVELRYAGAAGRYDRLPTLAAGLVSEGAAVVIAISPPAIRAAQDAAATTPIVFMLGDDPVKRGLVASLNKPGGRITGLSMMSAAGLAAKRLQILHELAPGGGRVGLLVNPDNATSPGQTSEVQAAAQAVGWKAETREARTEPEIDAALAALAKLRIGGLLIGTDPFFTARNAHIVGLVRQYRLPAVYEWRDYVDSGGLASYGSSRTDDYRILGVLAGKILAGANPADLPVIQPTEFELVINLKAAKELDLTIPPLILAQAGEIIE